MSKRINHIIELFFFQLLGFIIRLLPLSCINKVASILVKSVYPVLKSREKVALRNLANAYPELTDAARKAIARNSMISVAITFLELVWYPRLTKEMMLQRITILNPELLHTILNRKRGMVFLTAHYGSWEMTMQAMALIASVPMHAMAKAQSNSFIDQRITEWRTKFGLKVLPMGIGAREIFKALERGEIIGLAADQAAPMESVSVEFFGREVPTFQGPAMFSLRTEAPLVLGCSVRQPDGNYILQLSEVQTDDLKDASEDNVRILTQRHVKMTEDIIREHPEQWMWMHKRWKHVPDRILNTR